MLLIAGGYLNITSREFDVVYLDLPNRVIYHIKSRVRHTQAYHSTTAKDMVLPCKWCGTYQRVLVVVFGRYS